MSENIPKTELLYKKSKPIDHLDEIKALDLMISEHKKAVLEVKKAILSINDVVNSIYQHLCLHQKGRLIYVGAGTSGRIGIQDGVELFPTFNWPKERLDYIIAGGNKAILNAVENAEDNLVSANKIVIKKKVNLGDVVVGLAASGNTPFTCRVLEEASKKEALTIAISNNPKGKLLKYGKLNIILNTKEELIAGSTRLKAGTAQKICLNTISSMVMVKMGRVINGKMSDMVPTNKKLRDRKSRIIG